MTIMAPILSGSPPDSEQDEKLFDEFFYHLSWRRDDSLQCINYGKINPAKQILPAHLSAFRRLLINVQLNRLIFLHYVVLLCRRSDSGR